jgi:DNA polymerase
MPTIKPCPGCPYREFGPAIGPRGDPKSAIVLIGEAPGAKEIKKKKPFVGAAGDVLWGAVAEAGLHEADLFVTNSVACRPHPVRPRVAAIRACQGRLANDLGASPRLVLVALGTTALGAVTGDSLGVMEARRGPPFLSRWGLVVPTLHPARVLRRPKERPLLVEDLRRARDIAVHRG